ncbi:uncharacterized protein BXIN_1450 [Babesia sp. Xinjiang]|uniref:uncharacterized protein n=1 Tax=Babesia sp. Xinjiang TaxID=462227 RepID=UPI000A233FA6|nr:uncharacterized protein BXIN_1450 [Babesia sp. Xinjiang]ORM40070.1 hypothetical protein BXIN_1450 [Babesia sp. Xinjiang]
MKRSLTEESLKRPPAEETIFIAKAKPIQPEDLELIVLHRDITQEWRNIATTENPYGFVKLGLPTTEPPEPSDATLEEAEHDERYTRLLDLVDVSLLPEELMQTDYVPPRTVDVATEMVDVAQSMRRIDQVMEREANEEEPEEVPPPPMDDPMDLDVNDEHLVGDYSYSFCEEDDGF